MTSAMHAEYFGSAMVVTRFKAKKQWIRLAKLRDAELAHELTLGEEALPVTQVLRFHQRLSLMVEHNEVSRKVIPELFGNDFVVWYFVIYEGWLKDSDGRGDNYWTSGKHIQWLYDWMERIENEASIERIERWRRWVNEGQALAKKAQEGTLGPG